MGPDSLHNTMVTCPDWYYLKPKKPGETIQIWNFENSFSAFKNAEMVRGLIFKLI